MPFSIAHASSPVIHTDGHRRDTLYATGQADIFQLGNDGKTDILLNLDNGKLRFQGCRATRHDDHIHLQL